MGLDIAWLPWILGGIFLAFLIIGYGGQWLSHMIWPRPPEDPPTF